MPYPYIITARHGLIRQLTRTRTRKTFFFFAVQDKSKATALFFFLLLIRNLYLSSYTLTFSAYFLMSLTTLS